MALLKWGYDDEEEKKDETLGATPVQSVQSSWQPASSNASVTGQSANIFDQNTGQDDNNYLMSTQKSQIDQQLEARKAAEEAARQEANRQAEIARQSPVTYTETAQTTETPSQTPEAAAKNDSGWKKYYGDEFKKEQAGLDFFGRLLDNGQAAKRAETNARTKYNSEVLNQAYDDDGNTISQAAADKARILANENSNIANENSARGLAISRAIGATKDTQSQNFFDKVRQTVNAENNMSIYDAIFGVDDTQNFGIDDAGRFVGGLVQGIGTMPTIGAKELYEMGVGRGIDTSTGLEKDLNLAERAGRGVSGGINAISPFIGGSDKLLGSVAGLIGKKATTAIEQTALKKILSQYLFPALAESGEEAAQAGAEYFGYGGSLVDENGNIDRDKLLEFAAQTGTAGAMGFGGGVLMAGAGAGIKRLGDGKTKKGGDLTPIGGQKGINLPERPSQPVNTNLEFTPLLDAPNTNQIADSTIPNATLEPSQGSQFQPIADRLPIIGRENIPTTAINTRDKVGIDETDNYDTSLQKLDTALENGAITNDEHSQLENELFTAAEQRGEAIAETGADVPEETIKPTPKLKGDVTPTVAQNIPLVKSEQVRQLQESKAGTTQAEEAVINQRLQELRDNTPRLDSTNPTGSIFTEYDPQSRTGEFGENVTTLAEAAGKNADDMVTIYRGVPKGAQDKLATGDFVTTNEQLAKDYAGTGDVVAQQVKYRDIAADRNEWEGEEYIYRPSQADDIIREQARVADGTRTNEVMADSGSIPEWERQRNRALEMTEHVANSLESGTRVRTKGRVIGTSFAKGYRQNTEVLKNSSPNIAYEIDPKTGQVRQHESSEILSAFSRSIGEDLPPVIVGNTPKQGAGRRLESNTDGANATYSPSFNRLDYKEKRSVYHETMHHIDHFINEYRGENPKMLELQKLRKEITPEEVRKYKKVDSSADNVYEYVAHAMDVLLDGRLKKGELGAGVLKYVKAFFTEVKEALSSAYVYGRKGIETVKYIKELDRAIHEIDVSKMPKQKPLSPEDLKPTTSNLPQSMTPVKTPTVTKPKKTITPEQKSINDFAKRVFSNTDLHKDFRRRLARVLGLEKDTESPVSELLQQTSVKVSGRDKNIIQKRFNELEAITNEFNKLMRQQRKGYQNNKVAGLDEATSKRANQLIDTYGRIERDLNGYVRKIQGKKSIGNRVANIAENITGARNASILTSAGGVSRNISQELGANILETVLHPARMARGVVHMPAEIARAYKRTAKEFAVKPKTVSEVFPYAIGNTYRLIMSPVTGIANVRKGVARDALAESLLRAQGETPTRAEIKKFAGAMGADSEVVANNLMGIMNGMTSHGKGLEVMRAYQEFIKTGSAKAKATFLKNTERASNLAAKMTQMAAESDDPKVRIKVALVNTVFPFVNTASNLAKTAATYNLNPVSRSINDEVLRAVRSNPANTLAILKNFGATYGVMGGVYALYEQGVIGYNDGEEVDKPKGIYIDMGDGTFHAVRATPIELPIAAVVTAAEIAKHASEGDMRAPVYYAGILGNSLPYVDSTTNLTAGAASMVNSYLGGDGAGGTDDNGYAAKAFGVNMAKSYVPWSNNGVIPAINSQNGRSTNAKSVYASKEVPDGKGGTKTVTDMPKWFDQSLANSYGVNPFTGTTRDSLKDSRDNAGRVRTVDQQGLTSGIKKTINDKDTATHNETINNLVTFGRQNGLGRGTKDMFNTYDTGKNNNFKSTQDAITFLDVPDGENPDNAKKLEKNDKLSNLSQQIRDGFYGDTGSELLTLDGKELKSDASVPSTSGAKNSKLPLSMQSIKNAVAQTDLGKDDSDKLYAISGQKTELYNQLKAKSITYDQYSAAKSELEKGEIGILSNSKSYKKLGSLMDKLDQSGFFAAGGLGSTKSGQTYLWNSLNALLGSKGTTPAANYPDTSKGYTPWGRSGYGRKGSGGSNFNSTNKPTNTGTTGIKWEPVKARQMASVASSKYTPANIKVKLGNEVKKNKSQNYSDRSF